MPAAEPENELHGRRRRLVALTCLLVLVVAVLAAVGPASAQGERRPRVLATTVEGPITPVIRDHLGDGISQAQQEGYAAYLVRLDTPGGLDTSMRAIVRDILASDVPVIVHIAPSGARGASAGAIITYAAHVAAMAPGTSIGSATPVGGAGGEDLDEKVINDAAAYAESIAELRGRDVEFVVDSVREGRSGSATEALELGVVDVVATSTDDVLEAIDGTTVTTGTPARDVVLRTAGATVDEDDLGVLRTIQQMLADPNIAFLLLSIGTLGLVYELATPGIGVGGALGTTFIVVALFGLAVLPVNVVGIIFLVLAAVLFIAEVFAPGVGLAAAGGVLSLVLSGLFLIDDAPGLGLSLGVVVPTAVVVGAFVIVAGRIALRARAAPSTTTGVGRLLHRRGEVRVFHGQPQAFIDGAWWSVEPRDGSDRLSEGDTVEVVDVEGLRLIVHVVESQRGEPTGRPRKVPHE